MGNDGGSIPQRVDLVRVKKPLRQQVPLLHSRANHCALSKKRLVPPIVVCRKGKVFNKIDLISALVEKKSDPSIAHIKKMKHFAEVKGLSDPKSNSAVDPEFPLKCKFSGQAWNGKRKFFFAWNCGCVVSATAMEKLGVKKEEAKECPACGSPLGEEKLIELQGDEGKTEEGKEGLKIGEKVKDAKAEFERKEFHLSKRDKELEDEKLDKRQKRGSSGLDLDLGFEPLCPQSLMKLFVDKNAKKSAEEIQSGSCLHREKC